MSAQEFFDTLESRGEVDLGIGTTLAFSPGASRMIFVRRAFLRFAVGGATVSTFALFGELFQSRLNANIREQKGYSYVVSSRFAFHHFQDPAAVLAEMRRVEGTLLSALNVLIVVIVFRLLHVPADARGQRRQVLLAHPRHRRRRPGPC